MLVRLGDVDALAQAIDWMIGHEQEAREMGRRGRERMADFDVRQIIALHKALYDKALTVEVE